ncbi:cryptochrome/photolyase family protein [Meiothermus sp. QL-1]|uniref:cryptochrome/photolyase family protein n=1 Tax=Meiothermus sp. QL-1 TaxID=2058095 RepID=UPI000E0A1418|nr:cryptochrome/photolyase family protein [Meiothermus sp. QL-1]RDI95761.1 cryptochrome/photolyase family protein [Meiothermus sp. QL-1]
MNLWLLGDQLNHALVRQLAPRQVLLVEAYELGRTPPMHPQKLVLFFSAMRHFAQELRKEGYPVVYLRAERLEEALDRYFEEHPGATLSQVEPADHGFAERVRAWVEARGGHYQLLPNPLWLLPAEAFDRWAKGRDVYRLEHFYRYMRRRTGYLMQQGRPLGGVWNFDRENRKTPPSGYRPPEPLLFTPDALTRSVAAMVRARFRGHWGEIEPFAWPVTRKEALAALEDFVRHRLPQFGPYQDALLEQSWSLHHSLLSPALNLGLLHPAEVVERAVAAWAEGGVPLASLEGFVRQIIGWREFVYHVYRREMPALAQANQLEAERPLPPLYWGAPTRMRCLAVVVGRVRERGYAHHIERLMVLANFALIYGVLPQAANDWFMRAFVDSADWVMVPNVLGMGLFASPVLSSKPYAASGRYIARMGNHCAQCFYKVGETLGEQACPFNSLYWDFLIAHRSRLGGHPRLGALYGTLDRWGPAFQAALRQQAAFWRERIGQGEA